MRRVLLAGFLFLFSTGLVQAQNCTATGGVDWTARSAEASQWLSVTYGGGQFVAVANGGTNRVMTSPDGITWTARSAPEANQWHSVTYGGGQFVAVSDTGTNQVMTSPDGITWTARSAAGVSDWYSVTYGGGQFVAVGANSTNTVMSSPDGITWTARIAPENNTWLSVTYGGGQFVAVAAAFTNLVMTSPDGITWTARSAAEDNYWQSVTYGGGQFVAVSNTGANRVMTSPDGITWTARSAEASQWLSVTYGGGQFVAVAETGTNRVMTSPDGINWTARSAAEDNYWHSVTYGGGQFVAVSNTGANQVMTSSCEQTTPAEGSAVLAIQKVFADGNDETDVTLTLECSSGSYAPTQVTVTADVGLNHAFVVNQIPLVEGDGVDCTVVEQPIAGYSAQYRCPTVDSMSATDPSCEPDGGAVPEDNFACVWTNVQAGDSNNCLIVNDPLPVEVAVTKVWDVSNMGGDYVSRAAAIEIGCNAEILNASSEEGNWSYRNFYLSDGDYTDGMATVTVQVIPGYPSSECYAVESNVDSAVEVTSDCGTEAGPAMEVSAGSGDSCTITNTLFFEAIPALNQYGLALMALLMMGIGLVGFRRFA
jgi:hypothetical protein